MVMLLQSKILWDQLPKDLDNQEDRNSRQMAIHFQHPKARKERSKRDLPLNIHSSPVDPRCENEMVATRPIYFI